MTSENPNPEPMAELEELRARLAEAEETLRAIRSGEVDALLIAGEKGHEVKLLGAGDHIYRQFIEAVSEGTATLAAGGEILSCNDCLAKTLRRPLDQVVGTAIRDHLSPDDHETFNAILAQAGPESRRRKIRLKTSEGRLVPVYLSATLLHSAGVAPVFCLVLTDLEEVISAEETLRESEEEFRATFEQAAVGIAHLAPSGRWLRVNQKMADIVGYTSEELLAKTFHDITHPDYQETDQESIRELLAGVIKTFSKEKRYIRKDGSVIWGDLTVSLVRKPSGEPRYFIAVIEEITARKQAEASLQESEEKFSKAFHVSPYAIMITRLDDGTFMDVNDDFISMTGFTREEALSNSSIGLKLWVNEEDRQQMVANIHAGRVVAGHEYTFQARDGKLITGLLSAQIIMLKHGPCILSSINDITERKRTEDALLASKQIIEGIINAIPVRVFWKDKDLVFLGCNAAFARDAGFADAEDLIGKDDFQMVWKDQAELYRNDDRQIIESGDPKVLIEEPQTTLDGKTITLLTSKLPLRNSRGEITGVLGTYIDITERKRAEEALALQMRIAAIFLAVADEGMFDEVLKVVLEVMHSPFGIFGYLDEAGALVVPTITRQVWDKCQIPGKTITFPRETWGDSTWPRAIREKRVILVNERSTIVPTGHVDIRRHIALPILQRGEVVGLFQVANKETDYTDEDLGTLEAIASQVAPILHARLQRSRAEKRLSLLHRHNERILQSTAEGIMGLDLQGNQTFVNPAAARMLGYEAEELLGRPGHSIWHHTKPDGSPYPVEECELHSVLRDGRDHRSSDEVFWRKDGTSFPVEYTGSPVLDQNRTVGFVVTFADITERLHAVKVKAGLEDQLRQALKMEAVGALAGGVAHDFNNLTAIVLGYGEMLLGQLLPEDPARKSVEQILEAGRRSASLTRQLLAFSRKQPLQPVVLDLNPLLRNLEKMLGRIVGEDLHLEFKLAAELGRVTADPGQIEQVVTNLTVNARDAMPHGGRLTVETADVELDETSAPGHQSVIPGRYVLLALTDTGGGMDKATLARVYEPFFTTKEKGKGTGLGLATVYGIVKQSGGYIWAYSEPGQGTSFKIYLPRTDAEPPATAVDAGGETPRGSGERILLVEDEASLRELCEVVLSGLGYRVSAAESGPAALLLVEEKRLAPDLVITDVIMPGMSGAEMTERLRRNRPGLKVLYISGYPDGAIARHGILDPGTLLLNKPFSERTLAAKVREALGGDRVAGEVRETPGEMAAAAQPGRRVLMIDDDAQFRELVRHFCAKRGHVFTGVDSAAAALAALATLPFDVLLVDQNIPGTSGERVLQEIRAAGHATPAIVLTGDVASADMDVLRPLGVVRALEKSSNAEPLLQAIEELSAP